ncbi:hypothetical protein D0T49_00270 [Paludibacter sp. 221]|uniref:hypothetical protein n=1 Tax=Paludibacter sp. 221 TaxID=2302939 RepID=UPI0013D5B97E|nr:hypothetical protein [Paludibacter sp. 221]NDV45487.1 hypothetical protein [Paludibacter sp. 221]
MTREQQLKTLQSTKASKEQLREALAAALGVRYERANREKVVTIFTECRDVFLKTYKANTGLDYSFGAKDGRALACIIEKIGNAHDGNDTESLVTFKALIGNLPEWYKQNAFSLTVINNKFNEIVASIRKNGEKTGITNDYKARVLKDLIS